MQEELELVRHGGLRQVIQDELVLVDSYLRLWDLVIIDLLFDALELFSFLSLMVLVVFITYNCTAFKFPLECDSERMLLDVDKCIYAQVLDQLKSFEEMAPLVDKFKCSADDILDALLLFLFTLRQSELVKPLLNFPL